MSKNRITFTMYIQEASTYFTQSRNSSARSRKAIQELAMQAHVSSQYEEKSSVDQWLLSAITGDKGKLELAMNEGRWNINVTNDIGQSALLAACLGNQNDICQYLLKNGADVFHADIGGYTALHFASDPEILNLLIQFTEPEKHHCLVNARTKENSTPLHEAALHGPQERLQILLDHNAHVNAEDIDGSTPLHYSVCNSGKRSKCDKDIIDSLILANAEINKQNVYKKTPLLIACTQHIYSIDNVLKLLKAGADPMIPDLEGNTALHALFQGVDFLAVSPDEQLVKHIIDINKSQLATANNYGEYPFHFAILRADESIVLQYLLNSDNSQHLTDNLGRSILHLSCQRNFIEVLKTFLEDVRLMNKTDCLGRTVLHYGALFSDDGVSVNLILQSSSFTKFSSKDFFGLTALNYAQMRSNKVIFEIISSCPKTQSSSEDYFITEEDGHLSSNPQPENVDLNQLLDPIKLQSFQNIDARSLRPIEDVKEYIKCVWAASNIPTKHKASYNENKRKIEHFMKRLVDVMKNKDERFSGHLVMRGSSYEETKISDDGDYDYMLNLDVFSEFCEVKESPDDPPGYTKLCLKSNKSAVNVSEFFDSNGILSCDRVISRFGLLVAQALHEPYMWQDSGFDFIHKLRMDWKDRPALTISCFLRTKLHITPAKIDFLPAIQPKGWWPTSADDKIFSSKHYKSAGCQLIIKPPNVPFYQHAQFGNPRQYLKLSFSEAETYIMSKSPECIRQSLMISKLMLHRQVKIPYRLLHPTDCAGLEKAVASYIPKNSISTYLLKQCLFHEMKLESKHDKIADDTGVHILVWKIFDKLCEFLKKGNLPSVFLPDLNLLHTFQPSQDEEWSKFILAQVFRCSLSQTNDPFTIETVAHRHRATTKFEIKMHKTIQHLRRIIQSPEDR